MADVGYPSDPRDVQLLPGAIEGLQLLRQHGYALVVVSNQSGIARGILTPDDARRVNAELARQLRERGGITIDAFYLCPHHERDGCECRKPKPGLFEQAIAEHHYERGGSVAIGDRPRDVEAGRSAGVRTVRITGGPYGEERAASDSARADHDAPDLLSAAQWVLGNDSAGADHDEHEHHHEDKTHDEKERRAAS